MDPKKVAEAVAQTRARRRARGLRSIEAALHENDIALLDRLKGQLGVASRSEAIRVVLAKIDPDSITPADARVLKQSAA